MTKSKDFTKILFLIVIILSLVLSYGCSNNSNPNSFNYDIASSSINIERIKEHLEYLIDISPRVTATQGEIKSGEYIEEHFKSLKYITKKENFPIKKYTLNKVSLQIVIEGQINSYQPDVLTYSGSTPIDGLNNIPLIFANKGTVNDMIGLDLSNSIAVVNRGDITFKEKADNCLRKGALGVIIVNTDNNPLKATLGEPSDIPVISLSNTEGNKLINAIASGTVTVNLLVDTTVEDGHSNNIIATKESKTLKAKTLIIGAHYDSVDCPGANDNGSGTAAMLELAEILKDQDLPFNIKFIAFGAEEIGLRGSYYHVGNNYSTSEQRKDLIGMINMDMVGQGNTLRIARSLRESSDALSNVTLKALSDIKVTSHFDIAGRSDHVPFEEAGIPVVFLAYGPVDPKYYHTPEDDLNIIEYDKIENTIRGVLKTISQLN